MLLLTMSQDLEKLINQAKTQPSNCAFIISAECTEQLSRSRACHGDLKDRLHSRYKPSFVVSSVGFFSLIPHPKTVAQFVEFS